MSEYLERVRKYDSSPDEALVETIVKHLGIALQNRDSSFVAATDKTELDRIREGFCTKKLELSPEKADKLIAEVCEEMKGDNSKCRVTFYYLLSKKAAA